MATKIFVVDDDENLIRLLTAAFKSKGYEIQSMFTGKDAMSFLENEANAQSLSLLILDRLLPDMEGLEIMKFFHEKYGNRVPVLILSSLSAEKDVLDGLKRGATDYLLKPFSIDVLMKKVENLLQ